MAFKKKTAEEPAWGSRDSDIPTGLPGRAKCIATMKEDEAACEEILAGREKQRIVAAALANAKKRGGKK